MIKPDGSRGQKQRAEVLGFVSEIPTRAQESDLRPGGLIVAKCSQIRRKSNQRRVRKLKTLKNFSGGAERTRTVA